MENLWYLTLTGKEAVGLIKTLANMIDIRIIMERPIEE